MLKRLDHGDVVLPRIFTQEVVKKNLKMKKIQIHLKIIQFIK